jgi:hypothetical protein
MKPHAFAWVAAFEVFSGLAESNLGRSVIVFVQHRASVFVDLNRQEILTLNAYAADFQISSDRYLHGYSKTSQFGLRNAGNNAKNFPAQSGQNNLSTSTGPDFTNPVLSSMVNLAQCRLSDSSSSAPHLSHFRRSAIPYPPKPLENRQPA